MAGTIKNFLIYSFSYYTKNTNLNSPESQQNQWFLDPVWIMVFLTLIMIIIMILSMLRGRRQKSREPFEFPFEIVKPEDLAKYLEEKQMLTEITNDYISRETRKLFSPSDILSMKRKILIFGRASIGKTREALKLIRDVLLVGADPGVVLIPTTGTIPERFLSEQIPPILFNKAVVLLYDDLPNIIPSRFVKEESKTSNPKESLQKIIECFEEKTNQFHCVATARNELLDKIGSFDYKKDPFWKKFEILEICDLDVESEARMIQNLKNLYKIKISQNGLKQIQKINKGYSCESIVTFLKNRRNRRITLNEIKEDFKKEAFESWKKTTFDVLKVKVPEIEEIYKIFKFIRFHLHIAIVNSIVFVLAENLLRGKTRKRLRSYRKIISKSLDYLKAQNCISIKQNIITLPDYQLENFPDIDIESQISILLKKQKKIDLNSKNLIADALYSIGKSKYKEGSYSETIAKLLQSLDFNPKLSNAYFVMGNIYCYELKDYEKANYFFNKAIELNPQASIYFNGRGDTYFKRGDYDNAMKDFVKAIEINPEDYLAYFLRGLTFVKMEKYYESINDFTKVIVLNPNNSEAYLGRGIACFKVKAIEEAIKDYTKAIELDDEFVEAYIYRGNAYRELREIDKSIDDFTNAIRIDPNNSDAYFNRGNSHKDKNEYNNAINDYSKAVEIDPKNFMALIHRGNVYALQKNHDSAIVDFTEAIRINPSIAMAYYNRGNSYKDKKELNKAIEDYTEAVKIDPLYTDAFNNRGRIYLDMEDDNKAIIDFNRAIELNPNIANLFFNRGSTYVVRMELDKAIIDFTKAVEIDPNFALPMVFLAQIYKDRRNITMAKYWVEEANKRKDQLSSELSKTVKELFDTLMSKVILP